MYVWLIVVVVVQVVVWILWYFVCELCGEQVEFEFECDDWLDVVCCEVLQYVCEYFVWFEFDWGIGVVGIDQYLCEWLLFLVYGFQCVGDQVVWCIGIVVVEVVVVDFVEVVLCVEEYVVLWQFQQ